MEIRYTATERYKALKQRRKEKAKELKKQKEKTARRRAAKKKKEQTRKRRLKKMRDKYKPIHLKRLRRLQNRRAYIKRRAPVLKAHQDIGDVYGFYRIILTKNYYMTKELGRARWMSNAYTKYNEFINENRKGVICHKVIAQSNLQDKQPVVYEILLLKKINPEEDNGIRGLKNKEGSFVENSISNNPNYAIIAKDDWYIPETYNVYGYNPVSDRKTGQWIFDNIINKDCTRENLKNVFMLDNKLIVQYNDDLDLILCKDTDECRRLYNGLQQNVDKKNKYIFFSNTLSEGRKTWLYNKLEEKTGWTRKTFFKKKG